MYVIRYLSKIYYHTYSEMRNKAPQLRGLGVVSNVSLIPLCLSGSVVLGGISTSLMLCGFLANG